MAGPYKDYKPINPADRLWNLTNDTLRRVNDAGMHPDGEAWSKCCRANAGGDPANCAYVDKRLIASEPSAAPFPCTHRRTDEGHYRVCAGWNACHGAAYRKARGEPCTD